MTVVSSDPRSGLTVATIEETTEQGLASALCDATGAASVLADSSPATRRGWLYAVANALEMAREDLVQIAERETALGIDRLRGEVARAAGQLRFYGDVALEGSYLEVTVDHASPGPSLTRINRPLGPVAIFGASNFPFAFSVLGNDTGAAIAAGCPVVAKAHAAHVGLSVRLAELAVEALRSAGAPDGTLSLINGYQAGVDLVQAPEIGAVAFTGSQSGGMALWRLANERDVAIPVYAEMGTINPVVVTDTARADIVRIATGFVESFTLGHGQFCTKPGLMLAPKAAGFAEAVGASLREAAPSPVMLTEPIAEAIPAAVAQMEAAGARVVARTDVEGDGWRAPAIVMQADARDLLRGGRLLEECFGPVAIVCEYQSDQQLDEILDVLQGALAASVFTAGEDDPHGPRLLRKLSGKVGRVIVDGWPTGVAVTWAQHHGGPWPATTDAAETSVGAHALARFVRPVAFQSAYDSWLPPGAQDANPWRVPRRVEGRLEIPMDDV